MFDAYSVNTLRLDETRCTGCAICISVCPHGVFEQNGRVVRLAAAQACMECGACQRNCPFGAVTVESGVGCAGSMIRAALTGQKEAVCG
jgi:NAD-dependent dihydropyrimidine dehydrogenase PreA subunit